MESATLPVRLRRKAEVAYKQTPDCAVLLDPQTGKCFELNRVGSAVWSLLDGKLTLEEVCSCLDGAFAVPLEALRRDVARFATDLEAAGLAERNV